MAQLDFASLMPMFYHVYNPFSCYHSSLPCVIIYIILKAAASILRRRRNQIHVPRSHFRRRSRAGHPAVRNTRRHFIDRAAVAPYENGFEEISYYTLHRHGYDPRRLWI